MYWYNLVTFLNFHYLILFFLYEIEDLNNSMPFQFNPFNVENVSNNFLNEESTFIYSITSYKYLNKSIEI